MTFGVLTIDAGLMDLPKTAHTVRFAVTLVSVRGLSVRPSDHRKNLYPATACAWTGVPVPP